MTGHSALIAWIAHSVRDAGAVATLDALRRTRPDMIGVERASVGFHDTLAVFMVWAVDRLVRAGLTDIGIVWHPLTDVRSPLAWWDEATLASPEAAELFVPSTKALPGDPTPLEPSSTLTAA